MIGWFSSRANCALRPSLRELRRHAALENFHQNQKGTQEGVPLLFVIMSTSTTQNLSTHSFDHRVLIRRKPREKLKSVDLSITNLQHNSLDEYSSFRASSHIPDGAFSAQAAEFPPPAVALLESFALEKQRNLESMLSVVAEKEMQELRLRAKISALRAEMEALQ